MLSLWNLLYGINRSSYVFDDERRVKKRCDKNKKNIMMEVGRNE